MLIFLPLSIQITRYLISEYGTKVQMFGISDKFGFGEFLTWQLTLFDYKFSKYLLCNRVSQEIKKKLYKLKKYLYRAN